MNSPPQKSLERIIAENISALANDVAALLKGPLNRHAIITLLVASSKLSRANVAKVLDALQNLKKDYLNEKK